MSLKTRAAMTAFGGMMAFSAQAANELPASLMYHGNVIEPYCFNDLVTTEPSDEAKKLNIAKCQLPKMVAIDQQHPATLPERGYSYTQKGDNERTSQYIGYTYDGTTQGMDILTLSSSGGGSGFFTEVVGVHRAGDVITKVKRFTSGDRCNGGVAAVKVEGDKIIIDSNVTPGDFLHLPGANPHKLAVDQSLEESAMSCIGTLRTSNGTMIGFTPAPKDQRPTAGDAEWSKDYPYQACFNQLLDGVPSQKLWTNVQIKEFMNHFNHTCVEGKKAA